MTARRTPADITLTALAAALVLWSASRAWRQGPVFADLFEGLAFDLPTSSELLVGIPSAAYLVAGIVMAAAVVAKDWILSSQRSRLLVNILASLAALGFLSLFQAAMLNPMLEILERISGAA